MRLSLCVLLILGFSIESVARLKLSPPPKTEAECVQDQKRSYQKIKDYLTSDFMGVFKECRDSVSSQKDIRSRDGEGEQSLTRRVQSFNDHASITAVNQCVEKATRALNHKSCTRSPWERRTIKSGDPLDQQTRAFIKEMRSYGKGLKPAE